MASTINLGRWKRHVTRQLMAVVVLSAGVGASTAVHASDANAWMNSVFGASTGSTSAGTSWGQSFDTGSNSGPLLARGAPTVSKEGIAKLKEAIKRYRGIVKDGGWPKISEEAVGLQRGSSSPHVAKIRARLAATGDLRGSSGFSGTFDYYVAQAVMRFQRRHGLEPTGDLVNHSRRDKNGTRTVKAMSVSAQMRLNQLRKNVGRLQRMRSRAGKRYVMVNIPAAQVEAVEGGRVVSRHVAVVGKRERASPILTSNIHSIKFNPEWTLPPTVVRKDLIPKGRQMQRRGKESVLEKFEIDAYTTHGGRKLEPSKVNWRSSAVHSYVYMQEPGPSNPLGFVKIDFHNAHSVYMHDTPSQRVFGRADRAASSGCIRIQNIDRLVTWILAGNDDWSAGRISSLRRAHMQKEAKTTRVSVKRSTKVHFAYFTAWATPDGIVNFRSDLYRKDGVGRLASAY